MSDKCGNCDYADKSQCVYMKTVVTEALAAGEQDGKCKCGPGCACVNCTCSH